MKGKFKVAGQIIIGIIVSYIIITNESIVVRNFPDGISSLKNEIEYFDTKDLITTIPFIKDNEFNYNWLLPDSFEDYTWLIYCLVIIFIITAVSNGANITDGLDGLAAGTSAIVGITLSIFIYLSGNIIFSDYLKFFTYLILRVSNFSFSFVGACIGFIWYNSYCPSVYGDTGSLSTGAIIAVLAIIAKGIIDSSCGVFLIETYCCTTGFIFQVH